MQEENLETEKHGIWSGSGLLSSVFYFRMSCVYREPISEHQFCPVGVHPLVLFGPLQVDPLSHECYMF
jgi:hypothetical protein